GATDGVEHALQSVRQQITADRLALGLTFVVEQVAGVPRADLEALEPLYNTPSSKEAARRTLEESLGILADDFVALIAILKTAVPTAADLTTAADILARTVFAQAFLAIGRADRSGLDALPMLEQLGLGLAGYGRLSILRTVAARAALSTDEIDEAERIIA